MLNSYVRYENDKSAQDYYHLYAINIPIAMGNELSKVANEKHCPISALVRSWISEGLTHDRYYG